MRATDLGSVQVLKHGNLYLLTDAFGDIHPDSRGMGLYQGDSRLLSCAVLRVGGERPVLLQGSVGGNFRGGVVMTNPSADRNPDAKVHPVDEVSGRTIGISRDRLIGSDGLQERIRVVNHAERPITARLELELGSDGADIFEVRGYPRHARGRMLPIAVTDRRVTFRYDGLDDVRQSTHIAFSDPAHIEVSTSEERSAEVNLRWTIELAPGAIRDLGWTVWGTTRAAVAAATMAPPAGPSSPRCSRRSRASRPTKEPARTTPGSAARRPSPAITSCSTSS
jgi:glycogen debranching enzyme